MSLLRHYRKPKDNTLADNFIFPSYGFFLKTQLRNRVFVVYLFCDSLKITMIIQKIKNELNCNIFIESVGQQEWSGLEKKLKLAFSLQTSNS